MIVAKKVPLNDFDVQLTMSAREAALLLHIARFNDSIPQALPESYRGLTKQLLDNLRRSFDSVDGLSHVEEHLCKTEIT